MSAPAEIKLDLKQPQHFTGLQIKISIEKRLERKS